ncbi:peptidoglycan-binding protein [Deinococcus koreensis]|uniref:Peptidoglycan-binding protein n=2 Tax=Deinococcus koreensis TaxID=2054903 RepID=A0A2K3UYW8_9DEIO|nr:peptidoglycan-binding protein [Deinococcus koreensis]
MRVAQTLDGVLRNCPATFSKVGTATKRCVGSSLNVEQVRVKLGAALGGDLYGVWRSRDEQRSVYNWIRTSAGYVYLRLQADPDGRARTLVYLDVPLDSSLTAAPTSTSPAGTGNGSTQTGSTQIGSVTLTPADPKAPGKGDPTAAAPSPGVPASTQPARPEPAKTEPARPEPGSTEPPRSDPGTRADPAAPAPGVAPVPFRRVLQLQAKRQSGPDVAAVQNRLISLMRPMPAGRGDGWYGPVTAATVRAFQRANGLAPTGRVDQRTWDMLFSPAAKTFAPPNPA